MKTLPEILRDLIRKSGLTLSEISRKTKIPQPRLTVFMQGKDIRLLTADKLATFFKVWK